MPSLPLKLLMAPKFWIGSDLERMQSMDSRSDRHSWKIWKVHKVSRNYYTQNYNSQQVDWLSMGIPSKTKKVTRKSTHRCARLTCINCINCIISITCINCISCILWITWITMNLLENNMVMLFLCCLLIGSYAQKKDKKGNKKSKEWEKLKGNVCLWLKLFCSRLMK